MADASPAASAAPASQQGGSGVWNPNAGYLNAEARRTIGAPIYGTGSSPSTVQVPRDTCLKKMVIKLVLSVDTTYASGSPLLSFQGVFASICPRVEVNVNGNRIIKSVNPHLARLNNMILAAGLPRRATTYSAAAATVTRASREWMAGSIAFPATTEFLLVNEAFELNFENPWGYGGSRFLSELDIRDVASADLTFYFAAITNLQAAASSPATVTYGTPVVNISTQIVENRARPRPQPGQVLFDYVETSFSRSYTGQANNQQIDLQTGNYLMGIGIYTNNGGATSPPADNLLQQISLQINGATAIQGPVSQADLLDANVSRYGVESPLGIANYAATIASVASVQPLMGFSHMNLLRNGDWNTAINTSRQAGVDAIKLQFNTPASSGTDAGTYTTNAMQVLVHTHEIRPYAYTR